MTLTLFCLPHAGGTAALYRKWPGLLTGKARVHPLELPGRGARASEPPCSSFEQAVDDLVRQIRAGAADECALFGHSLGGLLAYEVARRLADGPAPVLRALVVSGCLAPDRRRTTPVLSTSADELLDQLVQLGTLPIEIARDPEAGAYFSGIVAADLRLAADYTYRAAGTALPCPVAALFGAEDPMTPGTHDRGWAAVSGREVAVTVLPGAGHAYVSEQAETTAHLVAAELEKLAPAFPGDSGKPGPENSPDLYLSLMKRVLTNLIYADPALPSTWSPNAEFDRISRESGLDWPSQAHTMVGVRRLDQMQECIEQVIREQVPGDFVETGVWRGGTSIFTRAVLQARGVRDRQVWAADSFAGMPEVAADAHPGDLALATHRFNPVMKVPLETVKHNFALYGLLDEQVRFLPGWFRDTLPTAPVGPIAVLRLDGDLYESTMVALQCLYPKVSPGGFVIVDDYLLDVCREAVHDYRREHAIVEPIQDIDGVGAYWRRAG